MADYFVVTAVNDDNIESTISEEAEGEPSPSAGPPNFLFIITDDQDTDTIGAYRNSNWDARYITRRDLLNPFVINDLTTGL